MNAQQRNVTIWDMFAVLWAVMSNALRAVDKLFSMTANLVTITGEVSETVLETGNQFADVGHDFATTVRRNQILKDEDQTKALVKDDPKMEERIASANKKIADDRNARRSRR